MFLFLVRTKFVTLTAFVLTWTTSAIRGGADDATNPITQPLYATGGLYETFQMTVGLGKPTQVISLTLCSLNSPDLILSANFAHDEGSCSMKNINRSALYNESLSSSFKWVNDSDNGGSPENLYWRKSPCVFRDYVRSFFDDLKVGPRIISASRQLVPLNLVENVTGTIVGGWKEAGFITVQPDRTLFWLMEYPMFVLTIRLYGVDGLNSNGAIMIGGPGEKFCETDATFVGTINAASIPSLSVDSMRIGDTERPVNSAALLALEYSISAIDAASMDAIANLTEAVFNSTTELYYVDCGKTASLPDMFFKIGSFEYYLSSEFYTRQVTADECVLMFAGSDTNDISGSWVLGTSFLKPYCLHIDYKEQRVSFAKIPGITYKDPFPTTPSAPSASLSTGAIAAIAASSVLSVCVAGGLILFFYLRRKILNQRIVNASPSSKYYYFNRFLSLKTGDHEKEFDEYELRPNDIRISDVLIGEGAYGKVYKGTLVATRRIGSSKEALATELTDEVAAKVLHSHASDQARAEFRREIDILKEVGHHPHILNIFACITHTPEMVLVAEFCPTGDLQAVLRRHRACIPSDSDVCQVEDNVCAVRKSLASFAWQVSDGMTFLASKKLVHRDLAARNVLLTSKMVAKIADFGKCIRSEEGASTENHKVPVRWTAPEALRSGQFSIASDVWSYGILLYELFTGGDMPYQGVEVENLLESLEDGGRLKQPVNCPDEIYCIMEKCWIELPAQRPSFEDIRSSVAGILEHRSYLYGYLNAAEHYQSPITNMSSP